MELLATRIRNSNEISTCLPVQRSTKRIGMGYMWAEWKSLDSVLIFVRWLPGRHVAMVEISASS